MLKLPNARSTIATLTTLAATAMLFTTNARADEGMWLLNAPPLAQLKERYNFTPDAAWLTRVQQASVRFNNGGSGSFVSPDGLVITNHHVAADAIYKLSTAEHDYLSKGFYAPTRADELKCVDLELNVLIAIENVTDRVNAAVKPGMNAADAFAARRAAKATIEQENLKKTGLRSDIVTLYQGAEYHLYQYKRYTDVRLVFAPEQQAAYFGGDPDNFEFPRFNLDCALVRVYENGQPAKIEHSFKWSANGAAENELVFVSGHPGNTSRSLTTAEFAFLRDTRIPFMQSYLKSYEVLLISWGARSIENERRAHDDLNSIQNSRKVYDGRAAALLDPVVMANKQAQDDALRAFAKTKPELADTLGAWDDIAVAQNRIAKDYARTYLLENSRFGSTLFGIARTLVRSADETQKPNGDRLSEYRESNRPSLELALFSEEPIYTDYEILKLTQYLTSTAQQLGINDPAVKALLGGKAPAERAAELINGTKVKDIAVRRKLYAMKPADIAALTEDPMIAVVRAIDADSRALRKTAEEQNEAREQAHAKIARVRYAKDGAAVYPDATFTLRLSYGAVKGYEQQGEHIAPFTKIGGMFARSDLQKNREPFNLPESWAKAKDKLNKDVPFDLVSTCDIIGGNSGSPLINRNAEFVGLIFDGNIQSLAGDYYYDEKDNRAVSVDSRAIIEAMKSVYNADALVAELQGNSK